MLFWTVVTTNTKMNYSISTDYLSDVGNPEESLKLAGEAGFSHVHWCHQWNTDFVYTNSEIKQIKKWLDEFGLKLLDLHGSVGKEKNWFADVEYQRLAGVELVKNRIDMTAELGGDAVVMHIPTWNREEEALKQNVNNLRRSLDELYDYSISRNIKIAIENIPNDDFIVIKSLLNDYSAEFLGLCYDSGHGNIGKCEGLKFLEQVKDRLVCIHLHDNDGESDQHKNPFYGTVNWAEVMKVIRESSYDKPLNLEVGFKNIDIEDKMDFLKLSLNNLIELETK
jgi:sugar phosphate isomerase/epimerase